MRTTTESGRRGDADFAKDFDEILQSTRKLLADTNAFLELKLEALSDAMSETNDSDDVKDLMSHIAETKKYLTVALDARNKALSHGFSCSPALDLEAAKDEVLRRLSRLAT